MLVCSNKSEGMKILAKLRADGHVWLTVPDIAMYGSGTRIKFALWEEDKPDPRIVPPLVQPLGLIVLNQKLHASYLTDHSGWKFADAYRNVYVKTKQIFAWAVEIYER